MDMLELIAGDKTNRFQKASLVLRTIGWMSIIWGLTISIWIWMGLKAGSQLWLWWSVAQVVLGLILLAVASRIQARFGRVAVEPGLEVEHRDRAA